MITNRSAYIWTLLRKRHFGRSKTMMAFGLVASVVTSGVVSADGAVASPPSWQIVASPNAGQHENNELWSVSCPDASHCWAVGSYTAAFNVDATLIESWNGDKWSIQSSPNTGSGYGDFLYDVTCTSSTDCWAVGYYSPNTSGPNSTLTEHWDGTSWSIVSSPNAGDDQGLFGISCPSATDCWAVGGYVIEGSGVPQRTLIEHWNGTAWAVVASPSSSSQDVLNGIACSSATTCWAYGYSRASTFSPLLLNWDGTAWTLLSGINSGTTDGFLQGGTCTSSASCWVVGATNSDQTLIETWNGSTWSVVSSPNGTTYPESFWNAVECSSPSHCWAVGDNGPTGPQAPLVELWNGADWVLKAVQTPSQQTALLGVACNTSSSCWAVGYSDSAKQILHTLIEHR